MGTQCTMGRDSELNVVRKRVECLLCGLKWTVGCGYTVYCGEG